jgi:alkyl hydroperoxide reductase subunit D
LCTALGILDPQEVLCVLDARPPGRPWLNLWTSNNSQQRDAKDLRSNLGSVLRQAEFTERQTWGTALSCAIACKNLHLIRAIEAEAAKHLDAANLSAAKTAAALMGMTNVFYRFRHLTSNEKYAAMPARLRVQMLRTHGGDPLDFELWCLAVSAINGCAACVDGHEKELRDKGVSEESILAAVRIASVLSAVASVCTVG